MRGAVLLLLALVLDLCSPPPGAAQQDPAVLDRINAQIQGQGRARVIVELRLPAGVHVPEGQLSPAAVTVQRSDIASAGAALGSKMQPGGPKFLHRYETLPYVVLEVDAAGLNQLKAAGLHVGRIFEDKPLSPTLYESGPLVEADQTAAIAWTAPDGRWPWWTAASTRRIRFSRVKSFRRPATYPAADVRTDSARRRARGRPPPPPIAPTVLTLRASWPATGPMPSRLRRR